MKRIPRTKTLTLAAVGLSLVGVLAGCASTTSDSSDAAGSSTSSGSTSSGSTSSGTSSSTSDDTSSYKDGTYTIDETYQSPGGAEEIAVSLTVKNDLITAVSVTTVRAEGQGARYQAQFESAISSVIVGKSLGGLSVSTVAGSSLTSAAFDSALASIRSEAT